MNRQGWFIGPNGELLFWVPSYLRPCSLATGIKLVIGDPGWWLDVTYLIHGQEWQKIKDRKSSSMSCHNHSIVLVESENQT